jgi:cation diffusion facilitator family transporter
MQSSTTRDQVRRVLVITLLLNAAVAIGKIIIGLASGALAITADGFHSLVDGSANVVALIANQVAARPPDATHPYGHRRFETIAALGIGAFLLLTAWEIVGSALERLGGSGERPELTPLTFAVMIGTLAINLFVTWYEAREGRRLRSELLMADSTHTRTDVWVSSSVLVSMVLVALGFLWVDTVAALIIVALILRAAWQVLRQTGSVLVDAAPYSADQLTTWIEEVPSVKQVTRVRSRGPADASHIDVDVEVAPEMTADHAAAIADAIREKLNQHLEGIEEVEVHFAPRSQGARDYALSARASADALGLTTHEVRVTEGQNGKVLEMHVEVPPEQTLGAAHEQVSRLESDVRQNIPEVSEVITHIEPAARAADSVDRASDHIRAIESQALALLCEHYPDTNWHNLRVYPSERGCSIAMHVTLPPQMSVEAAHRIAESAELMLRSAIPELERVTIHTEPPDEVN